MKRQRKVTKMISKTRLIVIGSTLLACGAFAQDQDKQKETQIEVQAQFIEFAKTDIDALLMAEDGGIPSKQAILGLAKRGKGKVICAPRKTASSGQEASVKATEEILYSARFSIVPQKVKGAQSNASKPFGVVPGKNEMREVGYYMQYVAQYAPADGTINIKAMLQKVAPPQWTTVKGKLFTSGKESPFDVMKQPAFQVKHLCTEITVTDGGSVLAGGGLSDTSGQTVTFIVVSAHTSAGAGIKNTQTVTPDRPVARQVEVQVQCIEFMNAEMNALPAAKDGGTPSKEAILGLLKKGKGKIVCAPRALTFSGKEVIIKSVEECMHPTGYSVFPRQNNAVIPVTSQPFVVYPETFEMREVGCVLQCVPEYAASDGTIHLMTSFQSISKPNWKPYKEKFATPGGKAFECPVLKAEFKTKALQNQITLKDGESAFAGDVIRDQVEGTATFMLVSANILDAEGDPIINNHPQITNGLPNKLLSAITPMKLKSTPVRVIR